MECDICSKDVTSQDDFFCASCARSYTYMARLEAARVLLENEQLNQQISTIIDVKDASETHNASIRQAQTSWRGRMLEAEKVAINSRIEDTQKSIADLRQDIAQLKMQIAHRGEKNAKKQDILRQLEQNIPSRRRASISTLSEVRDKGMTSFGNISSRSATTRAFLCREAATLLRLREKKRQKNGAILEQYTITGLVLPDLKEINNIRCTDLTASLVSTVHLLVLISFYLGIRLPAEITVPHRDYPLPTINTPAQSYLGHKTTFPGSGSISTAPSSPFSSKHDIKGPYRPRPLFVGSDDREEKVAQFAKRDPTAFNFFVEGISLLAWNIAWLCRTQGFSQGTNSWEEICDIGRNLHQLILGQPQPPALLRVLSSREAQKRRRPSSGASTPAQEVNTLSFAKLGQASHLSAHAFLGQTSFNEQARSWRYSKFNTVADALKKMLVTEMNNAEWELLEEQEWDDGGEQFDEAVFIKTKSTDIRDNDDVRSIMTTKAHFESVAQQQSASDQEQAKAKGTSGWTKLKSRTDG